MSEYTREEILKMIEEAGGAENLNLSGRDLSGIDLSREAIAQELEKHQNEHLGQTPVWYSKTTEGINLQRARLDWANLQEARLEGANLQEAILVGTNLQEARLWRAHLEKVDLSVAKSLAGAYFHQAWLDQTRMTREQLGGRIGEDVDKEYYQA